MKLLRKFHALFRKEKLDAEMSEEMRLHLEQRVEESIASGMSPEEARFAAMRKFGGVEQAKEIAREDRTWRWLENTVQDLRYAIRQTRKHPGFAIVVVLILGLGIGANTAVFSALEVLMFRALPVPAPDELVVVTKVRTGGASGPESDVYLSRAMFEGLRDRAQSFRGVLTLNGSGGTRALALPGAGAAEPVRVRTSDVSGSYFSVLGVAPLLGRLIAPADDEKDAPRPVAVISHAFWLRQFGGERGVVGKTVLIEKVRSRSSASRRRDSAA
ncbi:MAG: permease prefix domain 1-containing protein [Opitutaceae bacterium]